MTEKIIYPRSSRETLAGWHHLPRYVDKIRLHLAGKLDAGYHNNLGKGFDGMWLEAAGLNHEQFVDLVRKSLIDAEVVDWVRLHVKSSAEDRQAHWERMLNRPLPDNAEQRQRFQQKKADLGLGHRDDITNFVDLNDADEKRL